MDDDDEIIILKKKTDKIILSLKNILDTSSINHSSEIIKEKTLKDAHIYCKINNLSGQETGPLIEKYIQLTNNMIKNNASTCNGDLTCSNKINYEIKVSTGGKNNNKFNYVQIRINHNCIYILTAYHLCYQNLFRKGDLYIFKLTKENIKTLLLKHGSYAHGTLSKLGPIIQSDLDDVNNTKEYALRPIYGDKCWNDLLQYRIISII